MNRFVIYGIAVTLGLGAISAFYWHYTGLIEERTQLKIDKQELEKEVSATRAVLQEQRNITFEVVNQAAKATGIVRRNDEIFAEHNFQKLLNAKQGLILMRVNDGVARSSKLLECLTVSRETRGGPPSTCTDKP